MAPWSWLPHPSHAWSWLGSQGTAWHPASPGPNQPLLCPLDDSGVSTGSWVCRAQGAEWVSSQGGGCFSFRRLVLQLSAMARAGDSVLVLQRGWVH